MTKLLALLAALAKLVQPLLLFLRERKVRQEGVNTQVRAQQEAVIHDARDIQAAQNAADAEFQRDPTKILEDDGFRRD